MPSKPHSPNSLGASTVVWLRLILPLLSVESEMLFRVPE
jgi:hypothetical protein